MLKTVWEDLVKANERNNEEYLARFFLACRSGERPSLWSMVEASLNEASVLLGESVDSKPLEKACNAAEKHSANPYHNEHHNREVTLVTSLLLINHIRKGNKAGFKIRDARNLLMAASIHDLGHDGGSNTVNGTYYPLRLEMNSFRLGEILWQGLDVNKEDLNFIRACIIPTDVSKPKDGVSPHSVLVEKFNKESSKPNIYDNPLVKEAAAMLSDADLALSAALSPEFFAINSIMLEEETKGAVPANKNSAKYFLENVAGNFPLSTEGRFMLKNGYNKVKTAALGA